MKIKRIKKLQVNSTTFDVVWSKEVTGANFNYSPPKLEIGISNRTEDTIFMYICHELMEIVAIEMCVRLNRPDCDSDYIFIYDHRQHTTMMEMFAGLIRKFIN